MIPKRHFITRLQKQSEEGEKKGPEGTVGGMPITQRPREPEGFPAVSTSCTALGHDFGSLRPHGHSQEEYAGQSHGLSCAVPTLLRARELRGGGKFHSKLGWVQFRECN